MSLQNPSRQLINYQMMLVMLVRQKIINFNILRNFYKQINTTLRIQMMPNNIQVIHQSHKNNRQFCIKNTVNFPVSALNHQKPAPQKSFKSRTHEEMASEGEKNGVEGAQKNSGKYVKLEDINLLIRMFAYNIQERFQELDGLKPYGVNNRSSYTFGVTKKTEDPQCLDQVQNSEYFHRKFNNYKTTDPVQKTYLQKLTVRIQQIIDFFKQRSKNGNLVEIFIRNFQMKLKKILAQDTLAVDLLINQIIFLSENGFNFTKIRAPTLNIRERKYSVKKVQAINEQIKNQPHQKQNNIFDTSITKPVQHKPRAISLSAKHRTRKQNSLLITQQNLQQQLNSIYNAISDIDLSHLSKMIATANPKIQRLDTNLNNRYQKPTKKMQRELMKQNTSIHNALKQYERMYNRKKRKVQQSNPLKQIRNKQPMYSKMETGQNSKEISEYKYNQIDLKGKNGICNMISSNWMCRKNRLINAEMRRKKKFVEIQNLE